MYISPGAAHIRTFSTEQAHGRDALRPARVRIACAAGFVETRLHA